jgi:hypothetical protein
MEVSTRAAASTSIGEVSTRAHSEGQSEDQYEAGSRTFSNPNHCRAISFYFYRINKCQTVTFELVSIERRVVDPAAPTGVTINPSKPPTGVAVRSALVLATGSNRLDVARRAQDSSAVEQGANGAGVAATALQARAFAGAFAQATIPQATREAALQQVDEDLVKQGLLDKVGGQVSERARAALGWTRTMAMPTPGVVVKGCLDSCDMCEPELQRQIALDLERRALENALLQKQIDLLEQSQQYRCCPAQDAAPAP